MLRGRVLFAPAAVLLISACVSTGSRGCTPAPAALCSPASVPAGVGSAALAGMGSAAIATSQEALAFALVGSEPQAVANAAGSGPRPDPSCPVVATSGNTTTIQGGCTASDGKTWFGTATSVSAPSGQPGTYTYSGFGYSTNVTCASGAQATNSLTLDGQAATCTDSNGSRNAMDLRRVDVTYDLTTCSPATSTTAWVYSGGSTTGSAGDVHDGSGTVGISTYGQVTATTTAEVINSSVCRTEAASGTTTFVGGGDTVAITYDGATDCNPMSTVRWSLNGADQGQLTGVSCSIGGHAAGPLAPLAWIALVFGLAWRRLRPPARA